MFTYSIGLMLSGTAHELLLIINHSIALSQRYAEYGGAGVKEYAATLGYLG
ncbi:hypothetical protein D3C81_961310 [compost metagenome]